MQVCYEVQKEHVESFQPRQSPGLVGAIFHVMLPFAWEHGQDQEVGTSHLGNSPWLQLFALLSSPFSWGTESLVVKSTARSSVGINPLVLPSVRTNSPQDLHLSELERERMVAFQNQILRSANNNDKYKNISWHM